MMRLPPIAGEWIDRAVPLTFSFEGHEVPGFRGDTISSALAAGGVRVVGRSFKYHRPRGLVSFANHDVNAMMQVEAGGRSIPNVRADVTPVEPGWRITAVNTRGGVANDRLAWLDRLARFLPVGFYYKAFHGKRLFPHWERMFRALTGLGRVDTTAPLRATAKRYDFCDVLVIGAGPSGLSAALAAAEGGADVLLVDENGAAGGSALYARGGATQPTAAVAALIGSVAAEARVRTLLGGCAAGYYADHWVPVVTGEAIVKVRARAVVLAQGASEQPAVFRGNDLPGVMLASAAQRLIYRYAVAPARRIAVLAANAEGYAAALDAQSHGIDVAAVLDLRSTVGPRTQVYRERLLQNGVRVLNCVRPVEAIGGAGGCVARLEFTAPSGLESVNIDGLWMSVGFAPLTGLLHQAGGTVRYDSGAEQFVLDSLPAGTYGCGKLTGAYTLAECIEDGREAGRAAAAELGNSGRREASRRPAGAECSNHAYPVFRHPKGKEFIDFDEDLQIRDVENACQEGFDSSELLKRFSTMGMGPSQGKHSNLNALRVLARVRGESLEQHSLTTSRPMFHPVPMSHLAGRGFVPERRTPIDREHAVRGAVWMPAGNWRRPEYYARDGHTRAQAIAAEVGAVRGAVGLIDVGTLGKVEAFGPHAGEFLDRLYTGRFSNLKVGMTRYGLMVDETGVVIDDGVIARLGAECFYFTTTTGNSATLFREFGRLATWWGMPVGLVNLTGHFAAFNLAGPASRAVLAALTDLDLSDAAFPYLAAREAHVAGIACRLMRVGFVGELGYEIHVPAEFGVELWRVILQAGQSSGIRPFGVEAQRMLRLEKGHLIVGQDTDGVTNALEVDAAWAVKMDKPYFIGQRSLATLAQRPLRQTLVGFRLAAGGAQRPRESNLIIDGGRIAGRVTSIGVSPTLGHLIGLALVDPAVAAAGMLSLRIDSGAQITAEVVPTPFYDPLGEAQRRKEGA